jgi:tRNA U38,U39,U40 pseudouridine synthase TruA
MVRKVVAYLVEIGRGAPSDIDRRLQPGAELFQPTAPPSGLFLEAVTYGEPFTRPLASIVPVASRR